ncbi:MAG: hypothetical protein WC346_05110 [Methanogenium sp.]|jgi:hypothetical protein
MMNINKEKAEAEVPEDWARKIIKISCVLVIGVIIMNGISDAAVINDNDTLYDLAVSVQGAISSGYTLAALMVLALGAAAVMRFLNFI